MGVRPAVAGTPHRRWSCLQPAASDHYHFSHDVASSAGATFRMSTEQVQRDVDIDVLEAHLEDLCAESFSYTPPHPGASRQLRVCRMSVRSRVVLGGARRTCVLCRVVCRVPDVRFHFKRQLSCCCELFA